MQPINARPTISPELVKQALDDLLYTIDKKSPNPLRNLTLVDLFLNDPDLPHAPNNRELALKYVLTTQITEMLNEHRVIMGLPRVETRMALSLQVENQRIEADIRTANVELICWSWLYYRYVRVDLDMSIEHYITLTGITDRTLRRYQAHAIERLAEVLVEREHGARRQYRQIRLYSQLPVVAPMMLFGKEEAHAQVQRVMSQSTMRHMSISGEHGVGKTTFVQEVIRRQIEDDQINQLVWLDRPQSVYGVYERLRLSAEAQGMSVSLREYTLTANVVVVCDNADILRSSIGDLSKLLAEISTATVFLISRVPFRMSGSNTHIRLSSLSPSEAKRFVLSLLAAQHLGGESLSTEHMATLWAETKGNPQKLHKLVQEQFLQPDMQPAF